MTALYWTTPALNDLRKIDHWLTNECGKEFALRTLASIRFRARFLENFPHGGRPMLAHEFRVLRVPDTPYLIIYRLGGERLAVLRVRHERENWQVET